MARAKQPAAFPKTVSAEPNKDFFVQMLTRDIELGDAILDLLDNCVDGIVRSIGDKTKSDKPYARYYANITLEPGRFSIEDNCGGIPLELAKTKAFHMGRPQEHKEKSATVGMYGIGMKRAIFKIGTQAEVRSKNKGDAFEVVISKKWLSEPHNWDLPITKLDPNEIQHDGTLISIEGLRPEVARRFDESKDAFVKDFVSFVAQHYSVILEKGFRVKVNGKAVKSIPFELLTEDLKRVAKKKNASVLAPYIFEATVSGVQVKLAVGFYRRLPDEAEVEAEKLERASKDDAGWTIICNDRVVVYRDKTRLTGWGEAGIPNYHSQFIAITGVVVMQSDDPWKLPLTTTKRGIDPSSEIFSVVKDYMREGMRYFTRFTNRWKKFPEQRDQLYRSAKLVPYEELLQSVPPSIKGTVRAGSKGISLASRFVPDLPQPASQSADARISYLRPKKQVRFLAAELLGDPDAAPSEVGASCFDRVYHEIGGA